MSASLHAAYPSTKPPRRKGRRQRHDFQALLGGLARDLCVCFPLAKPADDVHPGLGDVHLQQLAKEMLFIQGAGEGAYHADKNLADSLRQALGSEYDVRYLVMPDEDNASYELWKQRIETELATMSGPVILVGHSVGASMLARCLAERAVDKPVAGIMLMSAPFWGGAGWRYERYQQLELPDDLASRLPQEAPVFLYHSHDDSIVPFSHLALYARLLPEANVREVDSGGDQLNNDLTLIATDIIGIE